MIKYFYAVTAQWNTDDGIETKQVTGIIHVPLDGSMDEEDLWDAICAEVRREVPAPLYSIVMYHRAPLTIPGTEAPIETPSPYLVGRASNRER